VDWSALGSGPVALDTAVFIYFVEEHPQFMPMVEPLFEAIDRGQIAAVTSSVTLLEVLVVPLRRGDTALAGQYERLLTRSSGLRLIDIDRPLLRAAATLRARGNLKTPDALQVATALECGAKALVTGDRDIPSLEGLPVLHLRPRVRGGA